ncbi:MAG: helix-turn-helix domain-containing protein [Clostridiales bacterium]|nr:helix-turn-helix domain-containing protein [Clostridiales bacterium]
MKKNNEAKTAKFAEILTQLRKEREISQKNAAQDLGISQALLSHYEKGIRECGLNFVIRCSEYYGVTTDYLLGASENRNGIMEDYFSFSDEGGYGNVIADATKAVLDNMISTAGRAPGTAKVLQEYYMLSLYRIALILAKTGALSTEIFSLDRTIGNDLASAAIALINARTAFVEDKSRSGEDAGDSEALKKLIETAENYLLDSFATE